MRLLWPKIYYYDYDNYIFYRVFYYLIMLDNNLYSDLENSILKYLIPRNATNKDCIDAYKDFYVSNLSQKKEILVNLEEVCDSLNEYFDLKYKKDEIYE